jgi:CyaY protein
MNDSEYHEKAAATLARIEEAVEASGADVDYETINEILVLEFEDASKIIVNKQSAAHQIWVAARSGGFHYDYDADKDRWFNDQTGAELFTELSRLTSEQAGASITLTN